jgi:hypothetical protein
VPCDSLNSKSQTEFLRPKYLKYGYKFITSLFDYFSKDLQYLVSSKQANRNRNNIQDSFSPHMPKYIPTHQTKIKLLLHIP